jgi:hypothetical protein
MVAAMLIFELLLLIGSVAIMSMVARDDELSPWLWGTLTMVAGGAAMLAPMPVLRVVVGAALVGVALYLRTVAREQWSGEAAEG